MKHVWNRLESASRVVRLKPFHIPPCFLPLFESPLMSGELDSCATGETGYAALLSRFEKQPVRFVAAIPGELPPSRQRRAAPVPAPASARRAESELLSDAEEQAAEHLREGWLLSTGGGMAPGLYRRFRKETAAGDSAQRRGFYDVWRSACRLKFLSPLMCVEIVCLGLHSDEVDHRHRMRAGTAAGNLRLCLGLVNEHYA